MLTVRAEKGVLDLSACPIEDLDLIKMQGEWEFHWKTFIDPKTDSAYSSEKPCEYIKVPLIWNGKIIAGHRIDGIGYASYRLKVLLPATISKPLGIKLLNVATACEVYVNGQKIGRIGTVGKTKNEMNPEYCAQLIYLPPSLSRLNIVIYVSNFHHRKGGLCDEMLFGTLDKLVFKQEKTYFIIFFMLGTISFMALYHLGLFITRKGEVSMLYFSLICLLVALRIAVTSERVICMLTHDYSLIIRLEYITFYSTLALLFMFFRRLFPLDFPLLLTKVIAVISLMFNLLLFFPPLFFSHTVFAFQIFIFFISLLIFWYIIKALYQKREGAKILFWGWIVLFLSIVNDILHVDELYYSDHYIYWGVFFFIFFQSFLLSKRFSTAFKLSEQLAQKLDDTNVNLEKIVEERTKKVEDQYRLLEEQNYKIKDFNTRITDSINYAQRIQSALLPSDQQLQEAFPESFNIFIPKDIVSGDFYWMKQTDDLIYLVLADCTGHGVPGSLMSMLGISLLNENLLREDIGTPASLLERMRDNIKHLLHQTGEFGEMNDGMDMAICMFDKRTQQLQFAGAHNPIYIFRENLDVLTDSYHSKYTFFELKPNSMPVGVYPNEMPFINHTFCLKENDTIYLFSDGFADQFGGESNRKYTTRRFKELLANVQSLNISDQKDYIFKEFETWKRDYEQIDDVSILGLRMDASFFDYQAVGELVGKNVRLEKNSK